MIKNYESDDLTVHWDAEKCAHSANCVKGLSTVFDPEATPWINTEGANNDQIAKTIDTCPSGALSYTWATVGEKSEDKEVDSPLFEVMKNGPVIFRGVCKLKSADGEIMERENVTALCRCGASENKPFCDGAHKRIGFVG